MKDDDRISVAVRVGKELREFIVSGHGSDLLSPDRRSVLWSIVKPWLGSRSQTPDTDVYPPDETVYILLRKGESIRTFCRVSGKVTNINTSYSHFFLDPRGEAAVRRHFSMMFKHSFRTYMAGYTAAGPQLGKLDGITAFCLDYGISIDEKTIQRLDKDWYRFRKKHGEDPVCPMVF